jgi:curved DNA-binding protein CbpA
MTLAKARSILGLTEQDDRATMKKNYRDLSFQLHPDRVSVDDDEKAKQYTAVRMAYDMLSSTGMKRSNEQESWYASLGGRARTDFVGPISLLSLQQAEQLLTERGLQSALAGLDTNLVQNFVARGQTMVVRKTQV